VVLAMVPAPMVSVVPREENVVKRRIIVTRAKAVKSPMVSVTPLMTMTMTTTITTVVHERVLVNPVVKNTVVVNFQSVVPNLVYVFWVDKNV